MFTSKGEERSMSTNDMGALRHPSLIGFQGNKQWLFLQTEMINRKCQNTSLEAFSSSSSSIARFSLDTGSSSFWFSSFSLTFTNPWFCTSYERFNTSNVSITIQVILKLRMAYNRIQPHEAFHMISEPVQCKEKNNRFDLLSSSTGTQIE